MPTPEEYEKGKEIQFTWKDYANKMWKIMIDRHQNVKTFIAVNDYCGDDVTNIKDGEHLNRRFVGGSSSNVFIKPDGAAPSHKTFLSFFTNKQNKERLQEFLRTVFSALDRKHGVQLTHCTRNMCIDLGSVPPSRVAQFESLKLISNLVRALTNP